MCRPAHEEREPRNLQTLRRPMMRASIPKAALLGVVVVIASWLVPECHVRAQTLKTIVQATLEEPNQKTSEISTDDLRGILATGSAVVFDARPPREYAMSHIPGAINVRSKPGLSMSQYVPDAGEIVGTLDGVFSSRSCLRSRA